MIAEFEILRDDFLGAHSEYNLKTKLCAEFKLILKNSTYVFRLNFYFTS